MIHDDAECTSGCFVFAILLARALFKHLTSSIKYIENKYVSRIKCSDAEALKSSTKVHIAFWKLSKRTIFHLQELHEYGVPYLNEASAVTVWVTLWSPLRIVRKSKIIKELRISSARLPCRQIRRYSRPAPPVLLGIISKDTLVAVHALGIAICLRTNIRESGLYTLFHKESLPYLNCFFVLFHSHRRVSCKHCDKKLLRIKPKSFGRICQERKDPRKLLFLEIVSQRPVAHHFKKGGVAIVPHFLNVSGPEGKLRINQSSSSWMLLTQKIRNQRLHATACEKSGRVVTRNDGSRGDYGMPTSGKES